MNRAVLITKSWCCKTLFEEYEAARETVFEMINLMKTYKDSLIDPLANCYLIPRSPGGLRPGA